MIIYLECYADEVFAKSLGATSKMIRHAFNKGEVCNMLRKSTGNVGIIDEDPGTGKPPYEREMLNRITVENDCFIVCIDELLNNKLIILRPALEDLVLKLCNESQIDITSFKLSSKKGKLHDDLSFKRNVTELKRFRELLEQLLTDNPRLAVLQKNMF